MTKIVMTVDDAATMRKMVGFTLRGGGYDVLEACDGNDALAQLAQRRVDLVITDVNMPGMNGIDLVRHLRALPHLRTTPILLLTTESDAEAKNRARQAGATGWIVKPFVPGQLLAAVARVVQSPVAPVA
jgi:two-component system chemotaxis response regulator CheY